MWRNHRSIPQAVVDEAEASPQIKSPLSRLKHAYAFCSGGNPKNLGMAATYVDDLHLGVADRFLLI